VQAPTGDADDDFSAQAGGEFEVSQFRGGGGHGFGRGGEISRGVEGGFLGRGGEIRRVGGLGSRGFGEGLGRGGWGLGIGAGLGAGIGLGLAEGALAGGVGP